MLAKRLGVRLKQLRAKRDLNQTDLAKKVGVTQAYIAMLEKGQQNPTLDVLEKLAKALRVTVGDLVK